MFKKDKGKSKGKKLSRNLPGGIKLCRENRRGKYIVKNSMAGGKALK
jgi:hypothetical protein